MDTLEKLYQQFPRTPKLKIIKVDVLREGVKYTPYGFKTMEHLLQAGAVRRRLIKKYMPEEDLGLWVYLSHHHKNSNDLISKNFNQGGK